MKKISAQIIADSVNKQGDRITSMVLTFPRLILAELNAHRLFSRNSASSRAIPFKKMVEMVETDPFIPIAWQKDHKGMQGTEYLDPCKKYTWDEIKNNIIKYYKDPLDYDESISDLIEEYVKPLFESNNGSMTLKEWWVKTSEIIIGCTLLLQAMGVTKQICNRLLEPFMWHTVILTATEFDNFFKLRCPQYELYLKNPGVIYNSKIDVIKEFPNYQLNTQNEWLELNKGQSEIHMMELAECMWDAMNESIPTVLNPGDWHIPFGDTISDKKTRIYYMTRKDDPIAVYNPSSYTEEELKDDSQYSGIPYEKKYWLPLAKKIATARCARVSYLNYEGKDDYEADVKLYDRLLDSAHMSPFEHCAQCMTEDDYHQNIKGHVDTVQETTNWKKYYPSDDSLGWCRNFKGFIQLRENLDKNV